MARSKFDRTGNRDAETSPAEDNFNPNADSGRDELVTGVPITNGVPEGSPQFAVYEAEERRQAIDNLARTADLPIEQRDNRGDSIGEDGKYEERMSIADIDALAEDMAKGSARGVERVQTQADGNSLTVTVTTPHGTSKATADVEKWNEAGVKKALKSIKAQMVGEEKPATDEPKDKLAESIREIARGGQ